MIIEEDIMQNNLNQNGDPISLLHEDLKDSYDIGSLE